MRVRKDPRGSGDARITKVPQYKAVISSTVIELHQWDHEAGKISASGGSSLAIDHCPPVENVACLVNGFLVHVVVSHRHLHVTVAHQISKRW